MKSTKVVKISAVVFILGLLLCTAHTVSAVVLGCCGIVLVVFGLFGLIKYFDPEFEFMSFIFDDSSDKGTDMHTSGMPMGGMGMFPFRSNSFSDTKSFYECELISDIITTPTNEEIDDIVKKLNLSEDVRVYGLSSPLVSNFLNVGKIKAERVVDDLCLLNCFAGQDVYTWFNIASNENNIEVKEGGIDAVYIFTNYGRIVYNKNTEKFYVLSSIEGIFGTQSRCITYVKY